MKAFASIWKMSVKFRIGFTMLAILILLGVFHQVLIRALLGNIDPLEIGTGGGIFENPSKAHLLGTDRYGRDMVGLLLSGLPITLEVAALAGLLSTALGAIIGFVAGYNGGRFGDTVLFTITDMFLVIPTLPLILILAAYAKGLGVIELSLVLSVFSWPFAARVIRSQVLSLRERPYVELSRMTNLSAWEIIWQDIFPNMLPYLGIGLAQASIGAAFALVGLTVLGLAPSGILDLGTLINNANQWGVLSLGKWWLFVAPMGILTLLFMGVALINQGLEDFYNPRLRGMS